MLRQGELTALAQHPSWPVYLGAIEEQIEYITRQVSRAALREPGISLEAQAYNRGLVKGLAQASVIPGHAENQLDRYLRDTAIDEEEEQRSA